MNSVNALFLAGMLSIAGPAVAGEIDGAAVLGGALGGAAGTAMGSALGGREGAILGGALGAGLGAAVGSDHRDRLRSEYGRRDVDYRLVQPDEYGPPFGHAHGYHGKHFKHRH